MHVTPDVLGVPGAAYVCASRVRSLLKIVFLVKPDQRFFRASVGVWGSATEKKTCVCIKHSWIIWLIYNFACHTSPCASVLAVTRSLERCEKHFLCYIHVQKQTDRHCVWDVIKEHTDNKFCLFWIQGSGRESNMESRTDLVRISVRIKLVRIWYGFSYGFWYQLLILTGVL